MNIVVKIIFMLAMVLLMAAPFLFEYLVFRRDRKNCISYKRFRIMLFASIYFVVATVVLIVLRELLAWIGSLGIVRWILGVMSFEEVVKYSSKLYSAIIVNIILGFGFIAAQLFVRIGLKKKKIFRELDEAAGEALSLEARVLKFFNNETWFFVSKILGGFNIVLSAAYAVIFLLYQVPAVFSADWVPYEFISSVFEAGYIYPTVSLILLWEAYFFFEGVKHMDAECPELAELGVGELEESPVDMNGIDEHCRKEFESYFACAVEKSGSEKADIVSEHEPVSEYIASSVSNDERNAKTPKEVYINCMDKIVRSEKNMIFKGSFFSEFSMYFLRYLSITLAKGDNIVFVCNDDEQIEAVYNYISQGLAEISSIYSEQTGVNFDHPIWRIAKAGGEKAREGDIDNSSILITTMGFICTDDFEKDHNEFLHLIDTIVMVDTLRTVNAYSRLLSIFNTRLEHIIKTNSQKSKNGAVNKGFGIRFMSKPVRYFCFDDGHAPGLDKVLKNLLCAEFDSADAMAVNPGTLLRCYKYDAEPGKEGVRETVHFIESDEELGAMMNMAVLCLAKGAPNVTVFADGTIPFSNITESIASNMNSLGFVVDERNLRINKYFYNPDGYSVIIALDTKNNLPATIRKYNSMMTDKPSMVIIFSRPYLFRDFYVDNIEKFWERTTQERIPVAEGTKKDIAQKILIKANAGGISENEILDLAKKIPQLERFADERDVNSILRAVLEEFGLTQTESLDVYEYFEYSSTRDFDENGEYNPEDKVTFREKGKLYEIISGRDMVRLVVNGEATHVLPLPKGRITQNYIAGQNLVYDGNIYYIDAIDKKAGKIFADLATAGENKENYKYIQSRYYTFDCSEETMEYAYIPRHGFIDKNKDDICVDEAFISVFRAPAEVFTKGYYVVDPHTMNENDPKMRYYSISDSGNDTLAKQTYRKYGNFKKPTYSNESMMYEEYKGAVGRGALAMSIRLTGKFGEDVRRTAALAGVMLGEIIREMFPSVADSVAVCPVFSGELPEEDVLRTQPKLSLIGGAEKNAEDFELWIIEDSDIDLGVVSVLMTSGNDVLKDIFEPMLAYLRWYTGKEGGKSDYLHYGMDHEPECFDFKALLGLAEILGESSLKNKFKEVANVIEYETCDFCGCRRVKGTGMVMLEDGRRMCSDCAKSVVGNNAKALKSYLDRAKIFLESTYGISLDEHYEFCFESTLKIVNTLRQNRELAIRGSDIPLKGYVQGKKAFAEFGIPSAGFSELLVRELTYIWQIKNIPDIDPELAEGQIALVAVQYLRFLRQQSIADMRANYYESTENSSGEGYRKLVAALLQNPQYNNNPFYYLLEISGGDSEEQIKRPTRRTKTKGDYGKRYTPAEDDRRKDGEVSYFYYDRLNADEQKMYTEVLHAIENHEPNVTADGFEFEDMRRIVKCVTYDHPTLFQYRTFSMLGSEITFQYGSTAEESAELMAKIEEAAAKYLEDIDDSMSAYDTALRLHDKIVVSVDYDTIALEKEHEQNGPPTDKIDYLRSICGVFLNGKAVCEGYARAFQYLLQKCGIECAECAGYILKENGEQGGGHAWNLIKLDGDYYYADPTWDDASNTVQTVKNMDIGFNYFCVTTDEILRSRDLALSPAEFPEYTATKCNYYYHNDLVLEGYDLERIKEMAVSAMKANETSFCFKCTKKKVLEEATNELFGESAGYNEVIKAASKVKKNISSITYNWDNTLYTITISFKTK